MLARRRNLFNDFLADPFDFDFFTGDLDRPRPARSNGFRSASIMKTDVKETGNAYEFTIDLPGFNKDNVEVELDEGYLTVSAHTDEEHEDHDKDGTYVRKERFSGSCKRSFYVGDDISENDISAKFDSGILHISVPKKELPAPEETKKLISID